MVEIFVCQPSILIPFDNASSLLGACVCAPIELSNFPMFAILFSKWHTRELKSISGLRILGSDLISLGKWFLEKCRITILLFSRIVYNNKRKKCQVFHLKKGWASILYRKVENLLQIILSFFSIFLRRPVFSVRFRREIKYARILEFRPRSK